MDSTSPRRRGLRISVRGLMILVILLAAVLGWYLSLVRTQQAAVSAIKAAGGRITYDWDWGDYNPNIVSYGGWPRMPRWLASRLAPDYVAAVVHVDLSPGRADKNKADDRTLEGVGQLHRLVTLWVPGTLVTDTGLTHLRGLSHLSDLNLRGTAVTDEGLLHLAGLSELRTIHLVGTRVTDAGVLALEEANPRLQIIREDNLEISSAQARAQDDLTYAAGLPVRVAAPVLINRAKLMNSRNDMVELVATLDALCVLESSDVFDLMRLSDARGECLGILEPSFSPRLSAAERKRLLKRCEDRGIDALSEAVERGYNNLRRLDGEGLETWMVGNLKNHPTYPKLIQAMKARRDLN